MGEPAIQLVLESASLDELLARMKAFQLDLILSNRPVVGKRQPNTVLTPGQPVSR
jgi:hypothetical protein